jgi:molybdopterin adenylyltransferase
VIEIRVGVLTCSDSRAQGRAEDTAGLALVERCEQRGWNVVAYHVCPSEMECISASIIEMTDVDDAHVVFTCGGTGLHPSDIVPEATTLVCERLVPGITEHIRVECVAPYPKTMFSRAVAGLREGSLVINFAGGDDAIKTSFALIADELEYAVSIASDRS